MVIQNIIIISLALLITIRGTDISAQQTAAQAPGQLRADTSGSAAEHLRIENEYILKAKQNIEKFRKGNATLLLTHATGKTLKNVQVKINQVLRIFCLVTYPKKFSDRELARGCNKV